MRVHPFLLVGLVSILTTGGCGDDPLTELIVAVDTDLSVPDEIDSIRIDVTGPGGELRRATGVLEGEGRLPATLGIAHRGGPLGPIRVTVTGRLAGRDVIQRRARVEFVPERVVVLRLTLDAACIGIRCPEEQTCAGGNCRAQQVAPSELSDWTGPIDRLDGSADHLDGSADGGVLDGCVPAPETCNGRDDDCDGDSDEDFSLSDDPQHCGDCDTACPADPEHAAGVCVDSMCELRCDRGWENCDGDVATGCETPVATTSDCGGCATTCEALTPFCAPGGGSTFDCVSVCGAVQIECAGSCVDPGTTPEHCGGCDMACTTPAHAKPACADGRCGFICDIGWRDCDADAINGCESRLREPVHCGACGVACAPTNAVASCTTGACSVVACLGMQADCNASVADGCEVDTATDLNHCSACGAACPGDPANATPSCEDGRCGVVCDPGFVNCNGDIGDGCEASLASSATCGSCGIRCEGATGLCAPLPFGGGFRCVADCGSDGTLCEGSCTDTDVDPRHCGGCGSECESRARATRGCEVGACGFACDVGWDDCDTMPGNGCEASLDTVANCGTCGVACTPDHGIGVCTVAGCAINSCDTGWGNCDAMVGNGCEADLVSDVAHCGACTNACFVPPGSTASCVDRTCGYDCNASRGDCDGVVSNGCETDVSSTLTDCGVCGTDCSALMDVVDATCEMGACVISECATDRADCNGDPSDGCDIDTSSDPTNCGGCGVDCMGGSCVMGACV